MRLKKANYELNRLPSTLSPCSAVCQEMKEKGAVEIKFGKCQLENFLLPTKVPRAAWWWPLAALGRLLFGSSNNGSKLKH